MISLKNIKNKSKKDNQNKTEINIIKKKNYIKSDNNKTIKSKFKPFPPKKDINPLNKSRKLNTKNRLINSMKSKPDIYSSNNIFVSQYIQNPNIYMKNNKAVRFNKDIMENNSKKNLKIPFNKNESNINKDEAFKLLESMYDIHNADYEKAIHNDKRGYLKMYWGFLVDTQIIFGTFCTDNHLDLLVIKLSFLVFTF